ncbi:MULTISPECIES: VOC family protein [Deinococcus]|uniref:VOC family protein n=1 Tax=Deinococcus rufus TaxID=2136097 RepID=A0ABV7Z5B0_9DEIO|nr:VOC family protein [Deinococcus sp. AB2017081]WQE95109.1 VOC family protein [Deinococcus sp. AB2017081]
MKVASLRIITDDIRRMVPFYETVTGLRARWANDHFAELVTPTFTVAIGSRRTMPVFSDGPLHTDNCSPLLELLVDDVDHEYERLKPLVGEYVMEPTTQPWGNRSIIFRDPDGHLLNLFTPVTEQARQKFGA